MKILVVEDDDDKLEDLRAFLTARYELELLDTAKSLQTGLRSILQRTYDLILLDMTMRNFDRSVTEDGGRPHAFAGREILRQMRRNGIETPAIVVTHFERFGDEADYTTLEQLKVELVEHFPNYVGTVQYRGNVDEWKVLLVEMISRVCS